MTPQQALRIIEAELEDSSDELYEGSELTKALNILWDTVILGHKKEV